MMLGIDYVIAPQVPRGLGPAVEGLAREILRERPRDIYTFAARHFDRLIKLRDKGRIVDKRFNGRDRLSIWTALNNNDVGDYRNCNSGFGSGKNNAFIRDTTLIREQPLATPIMRKVPKKKKQAAGRSGWSINETVKVFKKYKYASDIKHERLHDIVTKREAMEIGNFDDFEQCSSRHSEEIARGRLVRSASAGNVFTKSTEYPRKENEEFRTFVPCSKRNLINVKHECDKYCKIVNILNRQKSADHVTSLSARFRGTEDQPYISFKRKRSRSLVNQEGSNVNEESADVIIEERTGRSKTDRGSYNHHFGTPRAILAEGPQNEKKELEHMLYSEEEEDTKFNVRKNNEFVLDNVAENTSPCMQPVTSVVLPSVITRRKYTKHNECRFNNQLGSTDNLTLPPIPTDTLAPNERNDRLALPPLLAAEDVRSNSRITYCYEPTDSNVVRCDRVESVSPTETNKLESTNSESERSWHKCDGNEFSLFANSVVERHGIVTKEDLDIVPNSDLPERDIGETFKDSLNVTPDLIDAPQRPDSLEYVDDSSNTPMAIYNERENDGHGLRAEQICNGSNELKRKLIEIEMVEKNIETTLISSQGISACRNGFEGPYSIAFPTVDDSISDGSHFTRQNETVLIRDIDTSPPNDTNETNLSCCDSTVDDLNRIPDEHCQQVSDVPLERRFDDTMDKCSRLDELPSSKNKDTQKEYGVGGQNYVDPFGEYINSEIPVNSTAIVGVRFQHDAKSAIGCAAVYQDLENINEEEEDENVKRPNEIPDATERKKSFVKTDDSMEHKLFYNPINVTQTKWDEDVEEEKAEQISTGMSMNSKAKENMVYNNRSSNCSLSSDDIVPFIPELNLDSLRDLTISSLEENDSKYLERKVEVENCDVTSYDDENISSSSGNTLISEKNVTTLSSENGSSREQFFSNRRKILATGLDSESDASNCYEMVHQGCTSIDTPTADENETMFLNVKENTTDVSLHDFTEGTLVFRELASQNNGQLRPEQIGNDVHRCQQNKEGQERGDRVVEEGEGNSEQMQNLSSSKKQWNVSYQPAVTSERAITVGKVDDAISSLRHTGEFHDSFPLSLVELRTSFPTSNFYSLQAICATANHFPTDQLNFTQNQVFATVCDMSVANCKVVQTTAPCSTDTSNSFRLFENKPSWIEFWLNNPRHIIYIGPIVNETFTEKTIVSLENTISKLDPDDCREPLALDTTPKPIIIEEISNAQDEQENCKTVKSYETGIYRPGVTEECKGNRNANRNEAGKKKIRRSLLTYDTERFVIDNDSIRNVTRFSSIPRQNSNDATEKELAKEYQADEGSTK